METPIFNIQLPQNMRKIDTIFIHCSATVEGKDFTVEQIRDMHLKNNWNDIGYHFVIYRDGTIHPGRPIFYPGAHVVNHNAHSIGICYIGGLEKDTLKAKDTRTPQQQRALLSLVKQLLAIFGPLNIYGHKQFANKACPCFDVPAWVKENHLQSPATVPPPHTPSTENKTSKLEQVLESIKKLFTRDSTTPPQHEPIPRTIPMPDTPVIPLDDILHTKPIPGFQLEENYEELDAPEEPGWWDDIQ